jgi:hypothetical protein
MEERMNKFDVVKVRTAGFRVFRLSMDGLTITEASGGSGWKDPKNLEG